MSKKLSTIFIVVLLSGFIYLLFLFPVVKSKNFFWGSDAQVKHFPTRLYLYESLVDDKSFPVWTEHVLFGYPLYTDMENAYLNPVNLVLIYLTGPVVSYKIIHFLSYLVGSLALYYFLKRKDSGVVGRIGAILVYYFSYFSLNHLIHFNLLAISSLLPLNILLADLFLETKRKKYIFLQGLLIGYGILWGHPQITLLVLGAVFLYIFIVGNFLLLKSKIIYAVAIILLGLGVGAVQLLPTFRMYLHSAREVDDVSSEQGSYTPFSSLGYLFPYIFSTSGYYYGDEILDEYSYTEFYNYIGIVSVALFVYAAFALKKDKMFYYSYALLWFFLIFGYLRMFPVSFLSKFPVISSFRYWSRSILLAQFGLSILAGRVLGAKKYPRSDFSRRNFLLLSAPVIFLIFLGLLNINGSVVSLIRQGVINLRLDLLLKKDILLWIGLPLLTFLILNFLKISKKYLLTLQIFLLTFVFVDYLYFTTDVRTFRLKRWDSESGLLFPPYFDNKRIIDEYSIIKGMVALQKNAYTPYGYSQFIPKDYWDFYQRNNLGKYPRQSYVSEFLREGVDLDKLASFGISYLRNMNNQYKLRDSDALTFLSEPTRGELIVYRQGHLKLLFNNKEPEVLTTIKYDPNWEVKVNGAVVEYGKWEDVFIKLIAPLGEVELEFKYIPWDIYYGLMLGIGIIGLASFGLMKTDVK